MQADHCLSNRARPCERAYEILSRVEVERGLLVSIKKGMGLCVEMEDRIV